MDEQNSRLGAERVRGFANEDPAALETSGPSGTRENRASFDARHEVSRTSTERPGTADYSVRSVTDEPSERRTRQIREEIEQTREDMSETVNAIQDRLRPSTMASNAAERVRETARTTVREIADSEKERLDHLRTLTASPKA